MNILDPKNVDTIVIHVTASHFGDVKTIDSWHKQRGWSMIGYHFLITNVFPTFEDLKNMTPQIDYDGRVFLGRPIKYQGAHVKGHNNHTISIAMVGDSVQTPYGAPFSANQLFSVCDVIKQLMLQFENITKIKGHSEFENVNKSCPLINMNHVRELFNKF